MRYSFIEEKQAPLRFADRFLRRGKKQIGVLTSLKHILFSSVLNILLPLIPIAWVAHFLEWPHSLQFILSLLAIIPLQQLFEYGGTQLAFYVGKHVGDLVIVSLNNNVEGTLAIVLLTKCELRLLQSTIIGVVLLHLLLVPGAAFVTGGARVAHQDLHPVITQLNHTLLIMGVLSLLLPTASFAALDRGTSALGHTESVINAEIREQMINISRGLAVLLLLMYISARIFLLNPPGEGNTGLHQHPDAPLAYLDEEERLVQTEPDINQWVCIVMLLVTIGVMAVTAEWLVDSLDTIREIYSIKEEWFGLILLPAASFAGDGALAVVTYVRRLLRHYLGWQMPVYTLARAQSIDLSIQYLICWVPAFVLIGWSIDKPLLLLFDSFEIAILVCACFLVNYVTADAKVNWAEGVAMILFYIMIALTAWFYEGQMEISALLSLGPQCVSEGLDGVSAEH
ncbi:hypothetical protein K435DRAFT_647165 [Dendrothele bispora CBS 962.96]|uniref:Sodium/calcium exchanger membrane region domain-containing protein n=1 Tax=Dendrothele bispora (strain CBS 962.96) TaxID=1314807 RepID=A0A4S8MSU5_DENBC|nr:hypothetical protein K435DRAFT_647165 [Dendrothele bispora CBS 962.96]